MTKAKYTVLFLSCVGWLLLAGTFSVIELVIGGNGKIVIEARINCKQPQQAFHGTIEIQGKTNHHN